MADDSHLFPKDPSLAEGDSRLYKMLPTFYVALASACVLWQFSGLWAAQLLSFAVMWVLSSFYGYIGLVLGLSSSLFVGYLTGWGQGGMWQSGLFLSISCLSCYLLVAYSNWKASSLLSWNQQWLQEREKIRQLEEQIQSLQQMRLKESQEWALQCEEYDQEKNQIQTELASRRQEASHYKIQYEEWIKKRAVQDSEIEQEKERLSQKLLALGIDLEKERCEREKERESALGEKQDLERRWKEQVLLRQDFQQRLGEKQSEIDEYQKRIQEQESQICQLGEEIERRNQEALPSQEETHWQIQYNELRKQFLEKSETLNQTRKELFFVDNEKLALERDLMLQASEENSQETGLIHLLYDSEKECMRLQEELQQMEEIVSVLSLEKKKTTRVRKSKNENLQEELQLDLDQVLAAKIKKRAKIHSA